MGICTGGTIPGDCCSGNDGRLGGIDGVSA